MRRRWESILYNLAKIPEPHNPSGFCSLSPFLRGEGQGEGGRRLLLPLTPTLSPPSGGERECGC